MRNQSKVSGTRTYATIVFILVAVFIVGRFVLDVSEGRASLDLLGLISVLGWPLVCVGGLVFLWSDSTLGKVLTTLLFLQKPLATFGFATVHEQNPLLLANFWIEFCVVGISLYVLYFYNKKTHEKA